MKKSTKRWILGAGSGLILLIVISGILFFYGYRSWLRQTTADALKDSRIVETEFGIIEYNTLGKKENPVMLLFHGGGTGSNMVWIYREFADQGFYVICASRSGVKGTPYDPDASFEKSADMSAALLAKLGITRKVNVLGVSLGGPAALQFAIRHQDMTRTLIMMDAVSTPYYIHPAHKKTFIGKIFLSGSYLDFFGYLQYLEGKYAWSRLTKSWLEVITLYDSRKCDQIARQLAANPVDRNMLNLFVAITSPMSLYYKGMMQECHQAEKLPDYPLGQITAPTLVTHSRVDGSVAFSNGVNTAGKIPGAALFAFDGNGHLFFLGQDWLVIREKTLSFLKANNYQ